MRAGARVSESRRSRCGSAARSSASFVGRTSAQPPMAEAKRFRGGEKAVEVARPARRKVLLVTCPVDRISNRILALLGGSAERKTPPLLEWQPGPAAAPRIKDNICFARHMAVCLVPADAWEDDGLSFREKFGQGVFWEHPGSIGSKKSSHEGAWPLEKIASIEAVEPVGTTVMADEKISQIFDDLMRGWVYYPFWWNCQDFAVRLALLLLPKSAANQRWEALASILSQLKHDMMEQVVLRRDKLLFGLVSPSSLLECPWDGVKRVAMDVGLFLTTGGVLALLSRAISYVYGFVDAHRGRLYMSCMRALQSQFPELENLHRHMRRRFLERHSRVLGTPRGTSAKES